MCATNVKGYRERWLMKENKKEEISNWKVTRKDKFKGTQKV